MTGAKAQLNWDPLRTTSFESNEFGAKDPKLVSSGWEIVNITSELQFWTWNSKSAAFEVYTSFDEIPESGPYKLNQTYQYAIYWVTIKVRRQTTLYEHCQRMFQESY